MKLLEHIYLGTPGKDVLVLTYLCNEFSNKILHITRYLLILAPNTEPYSEKIVFIEL